MADTKLEEELPAVELEAPIKGETVSDLMDEAEEEVDIGVAGNGTDAGPVVSIPC
jgi:hypothetical protein